MKRKSRRVLNRTGKFECEICEEVHILQQHHIRGRDVHNANHQSNLANICANCHNKIHHGIVIVEDRRMTTLGWEVIWHHSNERSLTGDDAKPHIV